MTDRLFPLPPDGTIPGAPDWQWLHTPGHTEGSVSLWASDDGVLFSGDTLFPGGPGNTTFEGGDFDTIIGSLDRKLLTLLQQDSRLTLQELADRYPDDDEAKIFSALYITSTYFFISYCHHTA